MTFRIGDVVQSRAGHDKGEYFFVVKAEDGFVWLADGGSRKVEAPKRKRCKHIAPAGEWIHPAADRLRAGETLLNSEVRRALAAFRSRFSDTKEV